MRTILRTIAILLLFATLAVCKEVAIADFGADPLGVRNSGTAIQEALDSLENGDTLAAAPEGKYLVKDHLYLRGRANVTLAFRWATLFGPSNRLLFLVNCSDCQLRDLKIGRDSSNRFAGISLHGCTDCTIERIAKQGATQSGFSLSLCRDCTFRRIDNAGAGENAIGYMIHMSDDCELDRCTARDGDFVYGFQVKGGQRNRVVNCTVRNGDCKIA